MLKKLYNKIRNYISGFMLGMKTANDEMFIQKHSINSGNIVEVKEVAGSLADALLKGEVTQEVKDLRYRMYKILEEVDKFKLTFDKDGNYTVEKVSVPTDIRVKKNETVILVQDVLSFYDYGDGGDEILNMFDSNDIMGVTSTTFNYKMKQNKYLKINRDFTPKFRLEDYVNKVVLKTSKKKIIMEMYVSSYKDYIDTTQPFFLKELKTIHSKKDLRNNMLDINNLKFNVLNPRYSAHNNMLFHLDVVKLASIVEDKKLGSYIISYEVEINNVDVKLTEKYYEDKVETKYDNNTKKEITLTAFDSEIEEYHCEVCGKDMGEMIEDDDGDKYQSTERFDWLVTKRSYGKGMCVNCLEDYMLNIEK